MYDESHATSDRMKFRNVLPLIFLLAACGGFGSDLTSVAGTGKEAAITGDEASGIWSFALTPIVANCAGGGAGAGTVIISRLDFFPDGRLASETSTWKLSSSTFTRPVTGAVRLADGLFDSQLKGDGTSAMALSGTMVRSGSFSGKLVDPAAGAVAVLGGASCEYAVKGTRSGGANAL